MAQDTVWDPNHGLKIPNNGRRALRLRGYIILVSDCGTLFCQKLNDGRGRDNFSVLFVKIYNAYLVVIANINLI